MSKNKELNIYALLFAVKVSELSNIDVSSIAFLEAVDLIIMYSWFSRDGNFFVFISFFIPWRHVIRIASHWPFYICVCNRTILIACGRSWCVCVFVLPLRRWNIKMHVSMKIKNPYIFLSSFILLLMLFSFSLFCHDPLLSPIKNSSKNRSLIYI